MVPRLAEMCYGKRVERRGETGRSCSVVWLLSLGTTEMV